MHPGFTSQSSEVAFWAIGKSMRFRDLCMIPQVSIQGGRRDGVRFMKKHSPRMPLG
ncbi:MAG TPA: hypothetical protein VMN37_09940 [Gemmatimonadales bacterium]|nr:hypothetical protein [Gemmatimonadales bacterium]